MEKQWHEVLLHGDRGDAAFGSGAPLLLEALSILQRSGAVPHAIRVALHASDLASRREHYSSTAGDDRLKDEEEDSFTARSSSQQVEERVEAWQSLLDSLLELPLPTQTARQDGHRGVYDAVRRITQEGLPRHAEEKPQEHLLEQQSCLSYRTFHTQLERLSHLISSGELFSACAPRMNILQSRFRLYRAFNGQREDDYHPLFGGGDVKRAPKCDLRRLETCCSAAAVVELLHKLRREQPDYPLYTNHSEDGGVYGDEGADAAAATVTVSQALDGFFGPDVLPSERVLTEEALCLRPNYAADAAEQWMSLNNLGADTDGIRAEHARRLLRHVLSITGGPRRDGAILTLLVRQLLDHVTHSSSDLDRLELELSVTGHSEQEVYDVALWCASSGLYEAFPGVYFRLLVGQGAFHREESAKAGGKTGVQRACPRRDAAITFEDVLANIFAPFWLAMAAAEEPTASIGSTTSDREKKMLAVQQLIGRLCGVSVSLDNSSSVQEMPSPGSPRANCASYRVCDTAPPDAFFVYHVWRQTQMLNVALLESRQRFGPRALPLFLARGPLTVLLHGGTNNRTLFTESVLGLLLANTVVNPTTALEWSPMTYLYFLTQRHIILTPSRNRCCSSPSIRAVLNESAMTAVVEAGLHASIATLDPLFYSTSSDALTEELMETMKQRGFANVDMTELCLRSYEADGDVLLHRRDARRLYGHAWPRPRARFNHFGTTQVNSLRLHQRACSLEHELELVFARAEGLCHPGCLKSGTGSVGATVARIRLSLFLLTPSPASPAARAERPEVDLTLHSTSADTLQREQSPNLLQESAGYAGSERALLYPRIVIAGPKQMGPSQAAKRLMRVLARREVYQSCLTTYDPTLNGQKSTHGAAAAGADLALRDVNVVLACKNGVLGVRPALQSSHSTPFPLLPALPSWEAFQQDVRHLRALSGDDVTVSKYTSRRLAMLECKYHLHSALTNDDEEEFAWQTPSSQSARHSSETTAALSLQNMRNERGDVYTCVKVDVHCHMAGGITPRALLHFMKEKIGSHADDVVDVDRATGRPITLVDLFERVLCRRRDAQQDSRNGAASAPPHTHDVTSATAVERLVKNLTIAALQVQAGKATFHRFDRFNSRYSPMGMNELRSLFLKTDNFMEGRYFAELIRSVFRQNEAEGNTYTEYRLSVYGRDRGEWEKLARWFVMHGMAHRTNRWIIQVPRLFHLYRRSGLLQNFEEMLQHIFMPLWEASIDPAKHPHLSYFLSHVSGFDSVDNESDREADQVITAAPGQWTSSTNPPFAYYMYHMWANITTLNRYRSARGLNTFSFRPHAGESGDPDHMADVFFVADGIGHGINLAKRPVLQYLYYLTQIPLAVVPMSNNALFCKYEAHPLPSFLRRGLNVALGTDGALMFHHTEQPLLEEYSTAGALWGLSAADICELAQRSVRMSGFSHRQKSEWLGPLYALHSVVGNDAQRSHVPQTRCAFRYEVYLEEVAYLESRAATEMSCRAMRRPLEEELDTLDLVGLSRAEALELQCSGSPQWKIPSASRGSGKERKTLSSFTVSHV